MPVRAYAAKSAKGKLEPFEYDPGPLAPEDVEVRVTHCGICHSDIALIDNDFGFSSYPLVPGHEVIGMVAAVGSQVREPRPGQRVGIGWSCGSCGKCEWCQRGEQMYCANEKLTIVGRHGGWASSVRAHWNYALVIPDALDSAAAAPLLCAGTTVFTPLIHYNVTAPMRTAVVGIGGLGHLAVQYLAAFGCEVTAISSSHDKDETARKFGATHFIATRNSDELAKAQRSFDFILSTVPADVNWPALIDALRPQGRLAICGIPESDLKFNVFSILGEKSVSGARSGSPSDTAQMLAFSARHGIAAMIESFAMSDVNKAVDHVRTGKARYRAVLVA
ncbi:MAG: NAD(P)-dependent alcohol dehydrogenase [Tepidisphaeraceae bacterium]